VQFDEMDVKQANDVIITVERQQFCPPFMEAETSWMGRQGAD